MSRTRARCVLALFITLAVVALLPASRPPARRQPPPGAGDAVLHTSVIARLRNGEPYYPTVGAELRRGDYPTMSVFNWRTPLHYLTVARLPPSLASSILKFVTLMAVLATAWALARHGSATAITGTLAQMGALATAFQPDAIAVAEICCGVLIALSVSAYYRAWWVTGAALGALALFFRELAGPYCIVCSVLAIRNRRPREITLWIVCGAAYSVYFAAHVLQVHAHQLPGDLAHPEGWIQSNGLGFILATAGVNGWLRFAGRWGSVGYVLLGFAGTVSQSIAPHVRAAVITFAALFVVVGQPFNYYWGFITAPIWAFAVAHGADGFRRLIAAARTSAPTHGESL